MLINNSRFTKARITPLIRTFSVAFFAQLLFPLFFPQWHLLYFAPFLIFVYYRYSLTTSLWIATSTGIVQDLFAANYFGLSALNYMLSSLVLYRWKNHFFVDKLSTLPIMTFLFAIVSSGIHWLLLFFLGQSFPVTGAFLFTDFLLMPLADALCGFFLFTLPFFRGN